MCDCINTVYSHEPLALNYCSKILLNLREGKNYDAAR